MTTAYFEEDRQTYKKVSPFEYGFTVNDFLLLALLKPRRAVI